MFQLSIHTLYREIVSEHPDETEIVVLTETPEKIKVESDWHIPLTVVPITEDSWFQKYPIKFDRPDCIDPHFNRRFKFIGHVRVFAWDMFWNDPEVNVVVYCDNDVAWILGSGPGIWETLTTTQQPWMAFVDRMTTNKWLIFNQQTTYGNASLPENYSSHPWSEKIYDQSYGVNDGIVIIPRSCQSLSEDWKRCYIKLVQWLGHLFGNDQTALFYAMMEQNMVLSEHATATHPQLKYMVHYVYEKVFEPEQVQCWFDAWSISSREEYQKPKKKMVDSNVDQLLNRFLVYSTDPRLIWPKDVNVIQLFRSFWTLPHTEVNNMFFLPFMIGIQCEPTHTHVQTTLGSSIPFCGKWSPLFKSNQEGIFIPFTWFDTLPSKSWILRSVTTTRPNSIDKDVFYYTWNEIWDEMNTSDWSAQLLDKEVSDDGRRAIALLYVAYSYGGLVWNGDRWPMITHRNIFNAYDEWIGYDDDYQTSIDIFGSQYPRSHLVRNWLSLIWSNTTWRKQALCLNGTYGRFPITTHCFGECTLRRE
jgi:hypothetical protein